MWSSERVLIPLGYHGGQPKLSAHVNRRQEGIEQFPAALGKCGAHVKMLCSNKIEWHFGTHQKKKEKKTSSRRSTTKEFIRGHPVIRIHAKGFKAASNKCYSMHTVYKDCGKVVLKIAYTKEQVKFPWSDRRNMAGDIMKRTMPSIHRNSNTFETTCRTSLLKTHSHFRLRFPVTDVCPNEHCRSQTHVFIVTLTSIVWAVTWIFLFLQDTYDVAVERTPWDNVEK